MISFHQLLDDTVDVMKMFQYIDAIDDCKSHDHLQLQLSDSSSELFNVKYLFIFY